VNLLLPTATCNLSAYTFVVCKIMATYLLTYLLNPPATATQVMMSMTAMTTPPATAMIVTVVGVPLSFVLSLSFSFSVNAHTVTQQHRGIPKFGCPEWLPTIKCSYS